MCLQARANHGFRTVMALPASLLKPSHFIDVADDIDDIRAGLAESDYAVADMCVLRVRFAASCFSVAIDAIIELMNNHHPGIR
jgi:hypothetical protein